MSRHNKSNQDAVAEAAQRAAQKARLGDTVFKDCVAAHVEGLDGTILFYPNADEVTVKNLAYIANHHAIIVAGGSAQGKTTGDGVTYKFGAVRNTSLAEGRTDSGIISIYYRGRKYYGVAVDDNRTSVITNESVQDALWNYDSGDLAIPHINELRPIIKEDVGKELFALQERGPSSPGV